MKKTVMAALAVCVAAASTVAFSSCDGSKVSMTPAWYKNTTLTSNIIGTSEKLTYKIEYEEGSNTSAEITSDGGSYVTELKNSTYTWADGTVENVYLYTTQMNITMTYIVGGETETYSDSVSSEVYFSTVGDSLKPIKSVKTVKAHSPAYRNLSSLEDIAYYDYTITATYNNDCSEGASVISSGEESEETAFSIDTSYTYFDNEELLFALRGFDLGSGTSQTILFFNSYAKQVQKIKVANSSVSELTPSFTVGEEKTAVTGTVTYNAVTITLSTGQSGSSQLAYYAETTSTTNNTYRNVMIMNEVSMPYGFGTLTYSLDNAVFTEN